MSNIYSQKKLTFLKLVGNFLGNGLNILERKIEEMH